MSKKTTTDFRGSSEDAIISAIESGQSLTSLAAEMGEPRSSLAVWLNSDPARSARAMIARQHSAEAHDDKAERLIAQADDPFSLAKAKELAHHYRWRASKIAPQSYGDRTVLAGDPAAPLATTVDLSHATVEQLRAIAALKLGDK